MLVVWVSAMALVMVRLFFFCGKCFKCSNPTRKTLTLTSNYLRIQYLVSRLVDLSAPPCVSSSNICHIPILRKKILQYFLFRSPRLRIYAELWNLAMHCNALWHSNRIVFGAYPSIWGGKCAQNTLSLFSLFFCIFVCIEVSLSFLYVFSFLLCVNSVSMSKEILDFESINVFSVDPSIWRHKHA